MFRAARRHASREAAWRGLVALLVILLLASVDGADSRVTRAAAPGGIMAIRHAQLRAESAMRRADRQIHRLERRRAAHARKLHQARRRLERFRARREAARERSHQVRERLVTERAVRDRMLRVRPDPLGVQRADRPDLRRRVKRLGDRVDKLERRVKRLDRHTGKARRLLLARSRAAGEARIEARKATRERAESKLGAHIARMLTLSKEHAAARPGSAGRFLRPARGHVSQGYGCQASGRRRGVGSDCGRFHDGVDIATSPGARVRAAADGYVAYVGFNPWDRGRRSFVVIIGHEQGLETVYGHLRPVRRVAAGQRVRRGQTIGVVGLTGHTTGPHVHWEVSRDFQTMDPLSATL